MMIGRFLEYLRYERNKSVLTVQNYGEDLLKFELFFKKMDGHLSWESVDSDVIREWMDSMMVNGNSASSVCRRLSALRAFFRFALLSGIVDTDPTRFVRNPRTERPLPQFLKEKEMNELLDGDGMWDETFDDVRDRAVIMMFYETGIRLAELVALDDASVDFSKRQAKVTGKRNKQRIIPFGEGLAEALRGYVLLRDNTVAGCSGALFVSDDGMRLTRGQIQYMVKKRIGMVSTLKKRSPHVIRHTFATSLLNNGADIKSIKELLGHESVVTTEIYAHVTFEELKRIYKHAHPRA